MSKLKEIVARIQLIAPKISGEPLAGARYSPEASASATQCFSNAQRKAQQSGGGVLYGWMFQYREPTALPGQGYVLAVNHAVWHAPDKKLIDVTPFHDNPHLRWSRKIGQVLKLGSPWLEDEPMAGKRKRYSAEFKAKVALEALRGELTMAQLATRHGVHQTMISEWKRQAVDGLSSVFSGKTEAKEIAREGEVEKLHAKIGQLVVERDFLAKAFGR